MESVSSSRPACAITIRIALLSLTLAALTAPAPTRAQDEDPGDPEPPRAPTTEHRGPDNRLGAAETGYTGAVMLRMGSDVVVEGEVTAGSSGNPDDFRVVSTIDGNTLYVQAEDDDGNSVSFLAEFYWFESSIDRASDFFVGVVTARTSPYSVGDWVLERDVDPRLWYDRFRPDRPATLHFIADTDPGLAEGSFRWDWSLPFRNYGMDAYGTVKMEQNYSVGLTGNGSAMAAYQYDDECPGPEGEPIPGTTCEVKIDGQATGHFDTSYLVNTNYEITLHRWDVFANLSATRLDWALYLRTPDRVWENATHQYYLAMQTGEGEPFRITSLEARGAVKRQRDFLPDSHRELSVAISDIVLTRPPDAGRRTSPEGPGYDDEFPMEEDDAETYDDYEWSASDDFEEEAVAPPGGCAAAGPPRGSTGLAALLIVGLLALRRRRRA